MSSDLGLDPSDPLNLLLHNSSQNGDSSMEDSFEEGATPPDWSQLSALWPDNSDSNPGELGKSYQNSMAFNDLSSFSMDMDFNPSLSIEPSALHFDATKFVNPSMPYSFDPTSMSMLNADELLYPFNFQSALEGFMPSPSPSSASSLSSGKERRLSITSSSSSSGASFSPAPESIPSPTGYNSDIGQAQSEVSETNEKPNFAASDPAAELAQRVCQMAGVMLAVPMGAHLQSQGIDQQITYPTGQAKLPIPRLPRHNHPLNSKSMSPSISSAASTPPPSTPPLSSAQPPKITINGQAPSDAEAISTPTTSVPLTTNARPKTSHTTIERRYRTNLNARIQSLRMAVPALRVLEDREGKKIKKNVKGGVIVKGSGVEVPDNEDVDVIDERGFVDGVKVARKCSKANVLGKAVEYIRVLKKREQRLKSEQGGLKTLISGLVGGPALLREWEREWKERFGGAEKDEVEGEVDMDGDDEDSDDDDGEDGAEEEAGKKRKRVKLTPVKKEKLQEKEKKLFVQSQIQVVGEPGVEDIPPKRKRGRPRKVVPPPAPVKPVEPAPGLPRQDQVMQPPTNEGWPQEQQQQPQTEPRQYFLGVFALFSFFNSPLTSSYSRPSEHHHTGVVLNHMPLVYAPEIVSQFPAPSNSAVPGLAGWGWKDYIQVFHLLVAILVLGSFVSRWTGLGFKMRWPLSSRIIKRRNEKADWAKIGEESLLNGTASELSLFSRFQIYRTISSQTIPSAGDLSTLGMIISSSTGLIGKLARYKASAIWRAAKIQADRSFTRPGSAPKTKLAELLALEQLSPSEALARLQDKGASELYRGDGERSYIPLEVLGAMILRKTLEKHLETMFVDSVLGIPEDEKYEKKEAEAQIRQSVDAAKELGGRIEELGRIVEKVWKMPGAVTLDDIKDATEGVDEDSEDENVKALLTALVLYRKVFVEEREGMGEGTLLSPPPSPKLQAVDDDEVYMLRTALGSRVFEGAVEGGVLEDARDRVVDLVVDMQRKERRSTTP